MRPALLLSLFLLAVVLSGCSASNGADGQSAASAGNLAYNGASPGSNSSKFTCGTTGEVNFSSNLGSGSLTVTVKDGSGATVYSKTTSGPGQASESKSAKGAAGTWQVTATRGGSFTGQYAINVGC